MNMHKLNLVAVGVALSLTACTKSEGNVDPDATTTSADTGETTGDGSASSGMPGDTDDPPDTATSGPTTGDPPFDPEETHVVIYEDCGFEPSCDTLQVHIDTYPLEALVCAQDLHADGLTGLVLAQSIPGGGETYDPDFEHALFFTADRRVIRQTRGRYCPSPPCESPPWDAWREHEICEVESGFDVYAIGPCVEVPDFSCEELQALWDDPPVPAVPCADRPERNCNGPLSSERNCFWDDDFVVYPADSCEPVAAVGACREHDFVDDPGCTLPPLCAGVDREAVLFQTLDDGAVEIQTVFGCWIEEGFERCEWDGAGNLVYGPDACECVCG